MSTLPTPAILIHLGLPAELPPDLPTLNRVLRAWSARIPWESASRMARHTMATRATPPDFARSPESFFADALRLGTGGTCFETNFALRALLMALGFTATLHFCDMDDGSVPDPHCALVVAMDGTRFLADAGFPVPGALPLSEDTPTAVETPVYHYTADPAATRWAIGRTSAPYHARVFWLKQDPIPEPDFWARLLQDHAPGGLFLDEVIVTKVLDEATILRFSEGKGMIRRSPGLEEAVPLSSVEQADLPGTLARLFDMDARVLRSALTRTPPVGVWD
ncbi:MAG: arylamine N-acetyltransferase [Anaerolineae bacterium]|nr:arylamine N-acetyltransferase [Anaerolineae bacterium]